jgi:hypothetical protein
MESNNMYKNVILQFDGKNYAFWRIRMKTYVQAQGFQVWKLVVDGYKEATVLPINNNERKLSLNNSKSKKSLMTGIGDSVYGKFVHCSSEKEIWDKLQNVYEGD